MTIVELFPWLLAVCVTLISVAIMRGLRVPNEWSLSFGLALGITSWLLYVFGGRSLLSRLNKRQTEKEKAERDRRVYQPFNSNGSAPVGEHSYYECLVCGTTLPTSVKKQVSCKCRNITVDASGRPTVQNHERVKVFWFLDVFSGSVAWNMEFTRYEIEHREQIFRGSIAPCFSLGG